MPCHQLSVPLLLKFDSSNIKEKRQIFLPKWTEAYVPSTLLQLISLISPDLPLPTPEVGCSKRCKIIGGRLQITHQLPGQSPAVQLLRITIPPSITLQAKRDQKSACLSWDQAKSITQGRDMYAKTMFHSLTISNNKKQAENPLN